MYIITASFEKYILDGHKITQDSKVMQQFNGF